MYNTLPEFEIEGRKIGYEYNPLVVAEIGINHGGILENAFQMVDAAARAGVEVLKHQTHIVSDEMSIQAKKVIPSHTKESIYEIMEKCALSELEEIELQRYVKSKNMIFLSTPFSRAAAERLKKMKVEAYKIGSGECNNYPLLKHIASFGKPIILSTGMNTIANVHSAVEIFRRAKIPFALLHTTNVYPTPDHLVRLGALNELCTSFPDAVIGLSDHTTSNHACFGAVALGASILERHFTDSMNRVGPDISCSMDETECRDLIIGANRIKQMRGGIKGPVLEEKPTIDFAYASVVAIKDIQEGEVFSMENIWVKRPGTGEMLAEKFEEILGKIAARCIKSDEMLRINDIKN